MGTRIKTFNSTGVAPNGRLFAGDLNAMQDQYADLTNLSQAISVSSLVIGESGLQLLRFGSLEARITGLLRTDGIFRGLGGIVSGAFTTTARDAIALGSRPYGMIILNTTLNLYQWNSGTDATPVWISLGGGAFSQGLDGSKPAASVSNANALYFSTDVNGGTLFASTGAAWVKVSRGLTELITTAMITDGSVTTPKIASQPVTNRGASFTPVVGDRFSLNYINTAITITLPSDATAAFATGDSIDFMQTTAGQGTFAAGSGASVGSFASMLKTAGQYAMVTAIKTSTNTWVIVGNLTP